MAYIKNNWVDREGTTRYFETVDDDGALIFTPDYTQVTELGTPVNADNMNHIEEGIAAGSFTKYDTKATYALNDLVTVIEEASPVIYKSLQDNNIGNALSDSAYWEKISLGGGGGGLEIGDIGFTQMAIDETKGKRRKLNGQVIIQEQYPQFTNIIKNSVALNSDLACTEEEWQTAVTMSPNGVCYKFVIDDEAGTIRLPKYPEYLIDDVTVTFPTGNIPVKGTGMSLGLTNGSNLFGMSSGNTKDYDYLWPSYAGYGVNAGTSTPSDWVTDYRKAIGVTTDTSKSGMVAVLKTGSYNVEKIKGTYFIQVATGAETEDNIINEIELNNPFSLLDYKYSEYELNNLSWLRSNGQYNSKAIYPAVYDLLLKIYNGTETKAGVSVKLTTETFTDYDFVLNTAEETFRLPIKVKQKFFTGGDVPVVGNGMTLGITDGTNNSAMWYNTSQTQRVEVSNDLYGKNIGTGATYSGRLLNNLGIGVTTDSSKSGMVAKLSSTEVSGLYLYFYVGETVQNANLINAGRIEEKLVDKVDTNASNFTADGKSLISAWGMPSSKRYPLDLGASTSKYTAPANGWFTCACTGTTGSTYFEMVIGANDLGVTASFTGGWGRACLPVRKGEVITVYYGGNNFKAQSFHFIYAEGEQ